MSTRQIPMPILREANFQDLRNQERTSVTGSVKILLARHVSLRVFNNSRENNECRLIENPEQNNVGEISSRIARRAANLSGLIA